MLTLHKMHGAASKVCWGTMQADAFEPEQWREQLQGAVGVVSCLGGFGSNEFMLKVCIYTLFLLQTWLNVSKSDALLCLVAILC